MKNNKDVLWWEFGEALCKVYTQKSYIGWGYGSWREYLMRELEVGYSSASKRVNLYCHFSEMGVEVHGWVSGLSLSKAQALKPFVTDDNVKRIRRRVCRLSAARMKDRLEREFTRLT